MKVCVRVKKSKRWDVVYRVYRKLKKRLKEHNTRKVISTKTRIPLILICYEAYGYKEDALKRENFLKGSDGRKDIKKRMGRYFE